MMVFLSLPENHPTLNGLVHRGPINYFNPTPNSRNVEFDPKQNLMTNLKPDEGVSEP